MRSERQQLSLLLVVALFAFSFSPSLAQYSGGDFVESNEENNTVLYEAESEEELIEDLRQVLNLVPVGEFPRRKVECLDFPETLEGTKKALSVVKKVVPVLPRNYKIVVIGNADKRGPETSHRGQRGNDYWSAMRAKCVADYIVKNYPEAKNRLVIGGQGSKINKRVVTFEILSAKP